jgi:hypothetical protein
VQVDSRTELVIAVEIANRLGISPQRVNVLAGGHRLTQPSVQLTGARTEIGRKEEGAQRVRASHLELRRSVQGQAEEEIDPPPPAGRCSRIWCEGLEEERDPPPMALGRQHVQLFEIGVSRACDGYGRTE